MTMLDPGLSGKRSPAAKRGKKAKAKRTEPVKAKKMLETPAGSPFKTIPQYGRDNFGLSKNGSYDAAERGDFGEIITIGRRKFVKSQQSQGRSC
jgi:hypothetical protein